MYNIALAVLIAGMCVGSFKAGISLKNEHRVIAWMFIAAGIGFAIVIAYAVVLMFVFLITR